MYLINDELSNYYILDNGLRIQCHFLKDTFYLVNGDIINISEIEGIMIFPRFELYNIFFPNITSITIKELSENNLYFLKNHPFITDLCLSNTNNSQYNYYINNKILLKPNSIDSINIDIINIINNMELEYLYINNFCVDESIYKLNKFIKTILLANTNISTYVQETLQIVNHDISYVDIPHNVYNLINYYAKESGTITLLD